MQVRFPVYLVFTHMDAIEGFADFFRPFSRRTQQVWGVTVPLVQQKNAHSLFDTNSLIICTGGSFVDERFN